jgi:hypothetical protein
MSSKANVGSVLVALLEYTDAPTLEVLIGADNLLNLLRLEGWSDERIKQALRQDGRLPGEILLELLRSGRNARDLLASLGPSAVAEVEARRFMSASSSGNGPSTPRSGAPLPSLRPVNEEFTRRAVTERVRRPSLGFRYRLKKAGRALNPAHAGALERAGFALVLLAGVLPGLLATLDLAIAQALLRTDSWAIAGTAGALGALGGALFARDTTRRWAGILSGLLAAFAANLAVIAYARWGPGAGRVHLVRIEIAGPAIVGLLPGILSYAALAGPRRRHDRPPHAG